MVSSLRQKKEKTKTEIRIETDMVDGKTEVDIVIEEIGVRDHVDLANQGQDEVNGKRVHHQEAVDQWIGMTTPHNIS